MPSVNHLALRRFQATCWLLNMSSKVLADARYALWPVIFGYLITLSNRSCRIARYIKCPVWLFAMKPCA